MSAKKIAFSSKKKLKGRYTNYFKVGYNAFEFVLDFGQFYPEYEDAVLHTRIIMNPNSIKNFIEVLEESIMQYEQNHGAIEVQNHDS